MQLNRAAGFTLIEVMVVVVVIGVLAAIAYPNYTNYVLRGNRVDGREILQRIASAQERFYTNRNTYTEEITGAAGLSMLNVSDEGFYVVRAVVQDAGQSYTLTATAQGRQAIDKCGNLTLSNVGAKGFSGDESNGKCW